MKAVLATCPGAHVLGYGFYVPYQRIDIGTLAAQWGLGEAQTKMYRLNGRSRMAVAASDEDSVTLSIEAGRRLISALPGPYRVGALMVGSESHPYAVKPSSVIVAEALDLPPDLFSVDLEFACKGGTAAFLLSSALSQAAFCGSALAIGADCPQSAPGSLLEGSVGAGAAALLVGADAENSLARVLAIASASSDVTDFWRRDGARYPSMVGKFSVDEGYMALSARVATALLETTGYAPGDFAHVIFHQPYSALPNMLAKRLGFSPSQLRTGLASSRIGNTYSASTMLSLCAVLENAAPGELVFMVSFGSGAGSDGFVLEVGAALPTFRDRWRTHGLPTLEAELGREHCTELSYGEFARLQGKIS